MNSGDYISLALVLLYVLLGLVAFFGGMVIKGLSESIKALQVADKEMAREIAECVKRDDLQELREEHREYRKEQRELFKELFDKLEAIKDDVHNKVDRSEFSDTGSFKGRRQ